MLSLLLSALPVAFFVANAAAPEVLFSEDFEADDGFAQWDTSGEWTNIGAGGTGASESDGRKARAKGPGSDGLLSVDISTVGYENIEVSFDYRGELTTGNTVQASYITTGSTGIILVILSDNDNIWKSYDSTVTPVLLGAADNPEFSLRFSASSFSAASVELDVDNIVVTGTPIAVAPVKKVTEKIEVTGDTAAGENSPGWLFNRDLVNATPIEFNTDEMVIGDGALYVLPLSNSDAPRKFIGEYFWQGLIADLEDFSYDFKIGAGGDASDDNEFYLNVYANFGSSALTNYYDCKYDVVPTTGSTGSFTTVTFDPTSTYPVVTRGSSLHTCPASPADMDTLSTGSTIRAFSINTGDTSLADADLDGYFDNVVVDTTTKITTFDFEAEEEVILGCTDDSATNYDSDATENDGSCVFPFVSTCVDFPQNLLTNGSFETPLVTNGSKWQKFNSAQTGWTTAKVLGGTPTTLELQRDLFSNEAADGDQYAELDGDHSTRIAQMAATQVGGTYELSWASAARHNITAVHNQLNVLVNGTSAASTSPETGTAGLDAEDWTYGSRVFTADSVATEIAFADLGPSNSHGTYLDDAQLCLVEEPKAMLRVCKMILDEENMLTDGAATDASFSVDIAGPGGFKTTVSFPTPLVANTDLVDDNGTDLDAYCEVIELDQNGKYTYDRESITDGNAAWAEPLYHDFFTKVPAAIADFAEFTVDGSDDDNNDTDGVINVKKGKERTLAMVNTIESIPSAMINTTKIVCDYESELPDWSGSSPTVTADTANDWLAAQGEDTTCRIVPDWEFEWGDSSASNPGNAFVGPGGSDWTTFVGSTNVPLAAVDSRSFWMREVLPEGYIPFVGGENGNDRDSAELYCHTDGLNYDNFDRIDGPVDGGEYHCVAWNVPKELPPQTCSIFSDTETLVQDTNQFAVATHEHNNWSADIDDATWVWATERVENPGSEEMYTFVETFTVSNPTSALLDIAADNYYVVTVNGVEVLDRSAYSGNFTSASLKEDVDILPFLNVNGENTIEFKVVNLAGKDDYRKNPAGVLYRLDIEVDGRNGSCAITTEPVPELELPPVTSCSFVSNYAINDTPSQGNVASNLVSFGLNDLAYSTGDEFDLFVSGDTPANGPFSDEAVVERTSDGLRVFFYGTGVNAGPVKEFSGSFTLNGVDLTNAVIAADSEPNETTGNWPDAFEINPVTGEVTFTLFTNNGNDSFVITGLTENCLPPVDPQTYRISGFKWDDANGNGVYDESGSESEPEESTLSGWEIFLTQGATTTSTTTDGTGAYYFDVLAGEWTITEESPSGWTQTGQYQYGAPVTSSSQSFGACTFTIPDSENQPAFYTCSFGNQEDPESIDTEPEQRSTGGSSGTRILRVAAPAPLVLGATTDAPQFCPFLVDYLQMGTDNDRVAVMKLQMFLNTFRNLFGGTENPVTGNFGIITDTNVKKFQEFYKGEILQPWFDEGIVGHTKPTGFVYKTTLWKINSIVCPDTAVLPDLTGENLQSNVDLNARAEQD
jgi:hypothetical protein